MTLTRDAIDKAAVGFDLDTLVAEHLLGYSGVTKVPACESWDEHLVGRLAGAKPRPLLSYSTDLLSAWKILESRGGTLESPGCHEPSGNANKRWIAHIKARSDARPYRGDGDTPAEAICRAALEACYHESEGS